MATRINLGDHFYLWLPEEQSNIVVISSHGAVLNSMFMMPLNSTFKYYSLPTTSAYGGLETTIYDDKVRDTREYSTAHPKWNVIDDYILEKFQGRHGGGSESYDDIRRFVDEHKMNVLSVRHRTSIFVNKAEKQTYLSRAVSLISTSYPYITEFRCLFCRVEAEPAWRDVITGERQV